MGAGALGERQLQLRPRCLETGLTEAGPEKSHLSKASAPCAEQPHWNARAERLLQHGRPCAKRGRRDGGVPIPERGSRRSPGR